MRFNGQFHIHYYPEFRRWLREIAPDIVHFDEEPYNLATYLGLRASKCVWGAGVVLHLAESCFGQVSVALPGHGTDLFSMG